MLRIIAWSLLLVAVLGDGGVPQQEIERYNAEFDATNPKCDFPIRVKKGKVIHLELNEIQQGDVIQLFKGQSRFNEMILDLKATEKTIDIVTQTNEVCVWTGEEYPRIKPPTVVIQYTERDPVRTVSDKTVFSDQCGSVINATVAKLGQPKFDVMWSTVVLCDLVVKAPKNKYTVIETANDLKNSEVYADVYYKKVFQTYPLMNSGKFTFPSNHVRIRQIIRLAHNEMEPAFEGDFVTVNPPAIKNKQRCGSTYNGPSGTLLSPQYPPEYSGQVMCDYIFPNKIPSKLSLSFKQTEVANSRDTFISVLDIKSNKELIKVPIDSHLSKNIYLKGPSILRMQTPVKEGHGVSFTASYTIVVASY